MLRNPRTILVLVVLAGLVPRTASAQAATAQEAVDQAPVSGPQPAAEPTSDGADRAAKNDEAEALADAALADPSASKPAATAPAPAGQLSALDLYWRGGVLMYPITLMSFVVVVFTIERAIAIRRRRVIPRRLVKDLELLTERPGAFDVRAAQHVCDEYDSSLARIASAAIAHAGHGAGDMQVAVNEAANREATRLYKNVRPIQLAITITPLLGLLGTVQGMIQAFYVTASLPVGMNKAQNLAEGIYIALVTTFGGLCVAIPAAAIAHFFEGRIQTLLGDAQDIVSRLIPYLDRLDSRPAPRYEPAPPPVVDSRAAQPAQPRRGVKANQT